MSARTHEERAISLAESQTLNDIAFQFKTEAEKSIVENLTSRRPEFVRRVFRVEKASPGGLQAIAGTVQLDNSTFTGFIEQLGGADKRIRAPPFRTLTASTAISR